MCILAESVPCGAREQISRVPKMPSANPANGVMGRIVQGLLSIPELPKTVLVYQEFGTRLQGASEESFFNFFFSLQ